MKSKFRDFQSAYNDDLNMSRNFAIPLDYADMSIPDAVSN